MSLCPLFYTTTSTITNQVIVLRSAILLSVHGAWLAWSTHHSTVYMGEAGRENNIKYDHFIIKIHSIYLYIYFDTAGQTKWAKRH